MESSRNTFLIGGIIQIMVLVAVFAATSSSETLEQQTGITDGRRGVLNELLQEYVTAFEELGGKPDFKGHADSMKIVKDLIIQSWIYTLVPDTSLLQKVMTVGDHKDLKTIKERVINGLRDKNKSSVSDAMLKYLKTLEPRVVESFAKNLETVKSELDELGEKMSKEKDEEKRATFFPLIDEKDREVRIGVFLVDFVKTATRMSLQSYVLDFVDQEVREHDRKFQIKSSDGKESMEFEMLPLNRDSFEELLYGKEK